MQPLAKERFLIRGNVRSYQALNYVLSREGALGLEEVGILALQYLVKLETVQTLDSLLMESTDILLDVLAYITQVQSSHNSPSVHTASAQQAEAPV